MSILGVLYKVDGFPIISGINTPSSSISVTSNFKKDTSNSNSNPSVVNLVAVPVGVNLVPSSEQNRPKRSVQCCPKMCLSQVANSRRIAIKRKFNRINSKEDQMKYLKSMVCLNESNLKADKNAGPQHAAAADCNCSFLIPTEGECLSKVVCRNAFRYIFGLSTSMMNSLINRLEHKLLSEDSDTQVSSSKSKLRVQKQQSVCEKCGRTFATVYAMRRHSIQLCSQQRPAKKCQFQGCPQRFHHTTRLAAHMREVHSANIEPERHLKFLSVAEFFSWKHTEETRTFSLFTQNTGSRTLFDSRISLYACQRDGRDRAHVRSDQPKRKTARRRAKGRVKSNMTCVAYMKVETFTSGEVHVLYSPSHSHPLKLEDTVNHPITPTVKTAIEEKLKRGYSPKEILRKLKAQSTTHSITSDKVYVELEGRLVNQRVVSALARGKYPGGQHLHPSDSKAVEQLLEQLKTQQQSPLLAFSTLNNLSPASDAFLLVLQSQSQAQTLQRHLGAHKETVMYISTLEGTNSWGLVLFSATVADELVGGVPVASCLCSQCDSRAVVCFLEAMQTHLPELWDHVKALVVTPELIESAREALAVVRPSVRVLLSVRHTLLAMQAQLEEGVAPGELRQQLGRCLASLVAAKTRCQFFEKVKTLRVLCASSSKTVTFLRDFELRFLSRPAEWALCVRENPAAVHSCEYGESFHNLLLEYHQSRYPLKRVDDLIVSLLSVIEDFYGEESQQGWKAEIMRRHANYQGLVDSDMIVLDTNLPGQWEVRKTEDRASVIVTATSISASAPSPSDYHCNCADPVPLCCHTLSVHATQHSSVSDILVPEPPHVTPNTTDSHVVLVEVDSSVEAAMIDENVQVVRYIPNIDSFALCIHDDKAVVHVGKKNTTGNVCIEVTIDDG